MHWNHPVIDIVVLEKLYCMSMSYAAFHSFTFGVLSIESSIKASNFSNSFVVPLISLNALSHGLLVT